MSRDKVLISWIAVNNDPYEREAGMADFRMVDGKNLPGPTLTILKDHKSPFASQIKDFVLLYRKPSRGGDEREQRAIKQTISVLNEIKRDVKVHLRQWEGDDPTDHQSILAFLRDAIPEIRRQFIGRELVIHISPGTPSMQTIWVLMAETGFIDPPFLLVKSYRQNERHGRPPVVPVVVGIETFYKVYKAACPRQVESDERVIIWDPGKFRTVKMQNLFREARRSAHLNVPILILGERGIGKTNLASWIRLHSPFRREELDKHWPAVACGQYTPETMRSELFGYKKGAFTGAIKNTTGLLKTADKDTLFLDEIGDISRDVQRLLIKALEERKYFPLGDDHPEESNFRLVSATNLNFRLLRERLDADFLDRISTMILNIPPLREIPEEIPWLWQTVFDDVISRTGVTRQQADIEQITHTRVTDVLKRHPLPGNLRGLFQVGYRIAAARYDPQEPLSIDDSIEYGLQGLDNFSEHPGTVESFPITVFRAIAEGRHLKDVFTEGEVYRTRKIDQFLKGYLARELREISKRRRVPIERLCDVKDRTIRLWLLNKTEI